MARKAPSVVEWHGGRARLRSATQRTWILVPGGAECIGIPMRVEVEGERSDDVIFANTEAGDSPGRRSAAVPITKDGYFLAAKHSVRRGSQPALFLYDRTTKYLPKAQAQVVWRSGDEADVALLRTSLVIANPFELANIESFSAGDRVGVTGWSGLGKAGRFGAMAAGEIRAIRKLEEKQWWRPTDGPVCWQVEHNAPLQPGDSGGPLIDAKGRLIGINSGSRFRRVSTKEREADSTSVDKFRGISNIPDKAWLMQRIEEDRRSRQAD